MARPKSGEAMVTIAVRVPAEADEQIRMRADKAGQTRAVWVRDVLMAALGLGKRPIVSAPAAREFAKAPKDCNHNFRQRNGSCPSCGDQR
jgi:hypothetical protein